MVKSALFIPERLYVSVSPLSSSIAVTVSSVNPLERPSSIAVAYGAPRNSGESLASVTVIVRLVDVRPPFPSETCTMKGMVRIKGVKRRYQSFFKPEGLAAHVFAIKNPEHLGIFL